MAICLQPGCPAIVSSGRCPEHQPQARQARNQTQALQRGTAAQRGYGSRWRERSTAFRRKYPFCGQRPHGLPPVMSQCFEQGLKTLVIGTDEHKRPRGHVDHVVPHRNDPRLMWDELGNWQSLCARCHGAKSSAGL